MLKINRQTDYAVRVLLCLAQHQPGTRLPTATIQHKMLIPPAFLPRIVAQLAEANLVLTFPGRGGGLQLARLAQDINLREVVELFEGPIMLSDCMAEEDNCPFEDHCIVRPCWIRLQDTILKELSQTNFSDLAKEANAQTIVHNSSKV